MYDSTIYSKCAMVLKGAKGFQWFSKQTVIPVKLIMIYSNTKISGERDIPEIDSPLRHIIVKSQTHILFLSSRMTTNVAYVLH